MMLPLGFCHFKDRCYIKTARNYVQHQKKGFEDDSSTLRSVCWICCFFLVIFLFFFCFVFYMFRRLIIGVDWQCPGPITWQSDSVKTP